MRCAREQTSADGLTICRELYLSCAPTPGAEPTAAQRGAERRVLHLQTMAWPNYGVPRSTGPIRELLAKCREGRAAEGGGKTLVHCSGGVGRTGTFLASYAALASTAWHPSNAPVGPDFSLLPLVRALRRQRHPMCVEGREQLFFAYRVLADEANRDAGSGWG